MRDLELSSLGKPSFERLLFCRKSPIFKALYCMDFQESKVIGLLESGQLSDVCFFYKILERKSFCVLELDGYVVVDRGATYS
jgi:4'-phosphopantetheinyl transferase EntD